MSPRFAGASAAGRRCGDAGLGMAAMHHVCPSGSCWVSVAPLLPSFSLALFLKRVSLKLTASSSGNRRQEPDESCAS